MEIQVIAIEEMLYKHIEINYLDINIDKNIIRIFVEKIEKLKKEI